jgi:hypothetical protein
MARKPAGPRIATANRLRDGLVVFLRADGQWTLELNEARIAYDDDTAAILEANALQDQKTNHVVGVYLIEVEEQAGRGVVPVENRERLRNAGPTVGNSLNSHAPSLATQAA